MPASYKLEIADCLEALAKLPAESVDCIITDPPYCSGGFTESGKMHAKSQGMKTSDGTIQRLGWFQNDNMTTGGLIWLLRQVMIQAERILKPNTCAFVFADWRMVPHLAPALESSGMMYRNMIIWDKITPGMGQGFRARHETILMFIKGKPKYNSWKLGNLLAHKRVTPGKKNHPTEKPVALIEDLLLTTTQPEDTVCDPFMGSGSTALACQKNERNFIGFDRSAHFVNSAHIRLKEASA